MPPLDLTDDDRAALIELLRETIDGSRFLLSPRIRGLRAILEKLDPSAATGAGAATEAAGLSGRSQILIVFIVAWYFAPRARAAGPSSR
jgi:hypothetical protein